MTMNILNNESLYRKSGRITSIDDVIYLGFSGGFIEFVTDSDKISIEFVTDKELLDEILYGRVAVYMNDVCMADIMLNKSSITINIENEFNNSNNGYIKGNVIRIEKLSEAAFGLVGIKTVMVSDNSFVSATKPHDKRIEFIGDSITCGYGVEAGNELQTFKTSEENAEKAYAIKASRLLGVEYSLVSWSGTGTLSNWVPPEINEPLDEMLMPHLYKYHDLRLAQRLSISPRMYDNNEYNPDLVVIFLGTNDDSYVRQMPEREKEYEEKYYPFLLQVHEANPNSAMLCMLGTMGRNLCQVEEKCINRFKEEHPGVKIDFLWLPEQDSTIDGYGADWHPSFTTQDKLSKIVADYIKKYMNW